MDDPLRTFAAFVAAVADGILNILAGGRRRPSEPQSPHGGQPVVFAIMRMDCGYRAGPRSARVAETLAARLSLCERCRSKKQLDS